MTSDISLILIQTDAKIVTQLAKLVMEIYQVIVLLAMESNIFMKTNVRLNVLTHTIIMQIIHVKNV